MGIISDQQLPDNSPSVQVEENGSKPGASPHEVPAQS